MKKIISNTTLRYGLFVIGGILLGWLFFHSPKQPSDSIESSIQNEKDKVWTCAMHPQIHMTEPGKCPICGMDLIQLNLGDAEIDPAAVHLSKEAVQLANVLTSVVTRKQPVKEVRLYGKVQADERLRQSQVSHINGRIERLMVNFTGERVQKGQILALVYSPELVTAQQELLEAAKTKQTLPEIYEAAREKLRLWKLPESRIASIENSGTVQNNVEVVSNTTGIVTARRVNNGDYISQGTVLFEIADLSKVWVLFDAYESDLQFLQEGDRLEFNVQAIPGRKFSGNIAFIDPFIDPLTRVAKVRIESDNQSGNLKPEMFATGIVKSRLDGYKNKLVIPKSSVLWTGTRSIVYVKQGGSDEPVFKIREIGLGPILGNSYVVTDGLMEGEEIVTQGAFSIDATAQLEGKPSMMNPPGAISSGPGLEVEGTELKMQLNLVLDHYIGLKDVLVEGDGTKAKQAALKVQKSLAQVGKELMTGDARIQWMKISEKLNKAILQISTANTIEEQRIAYADFTGEFYTTIKTFGLMDKTVYYQFCPMAFKGKGAYWLSTIKEIRNPYFGDAMLSCGETKETLEY